MYMTEQFGAWQVGDDPDGGPVTFRVFFPDRAKDPTQYEAARRDDSGNDIPDYGNPRIASIQVVGDFQHLLLQQDWDAPGAPLLVRQEHPKGAVWTYATERPLPAGFYQYKYFVTFEDGTQRFVGDPCTRYGGYANQNSAVAVGGTFPAASPLPTPRKPLRDLIVYELMIDDFTAEFRECRAPLDAVRDKLTYLKDTLGVNALLFLPWTAWPGRGFSWGYTPYQYFSVEYRYANALDQPQEKLSWLVNLINQCHAAGLHVLMDGVFNHVGDVSPQQEVADGFPYFWLYQNPRACPYVGRFGGEFAGLLDLDYHNGCTREFIRDACLYWIDAFQIDGIRFDNAVNYYVAGDDRGLPTLLDDIRQHTQDAAQTHFSLTLEFLNEDAAAVTNATAATSYWNNALYERCFDYLWNGQIDSRLLAALDTHRGLAPDKVATLYLGNHDHSHVAWQAGARDNLGSLAWYRTQPYAIALCTSPGVVMIQNGQEFAEDYWIMEDDDGSGRRVKPRPLRWDFEFDRIGSGLLSLYARLIRLRKEHAGLRSDNLYPSPWETWQTQFSPEGYGVDVGRQLAIYHRWGSAEDGALERFIVVINFSDDPQWTDIPFPADGDWNDLLNDRADTVQSFRLANQRIESNWGRVYFQRS